MRHVYDDIMSGLGDGYDVLGPAGFVAVAVLVFVALALLAQG